MIQHVLMGYGYSASFLAQELLALNLKCLAISRHPPKMTIQGLEHICCDLNNEIPDIQHPYVLYYFIPPSQTNKDPLLADCLKHLKQKPIKIIYLGSSGVYGEHHGQWVNESSKCVIKTPRQLARLDAEDIIQKYCSQNKIIGTCLRIAGIYGPNRIPLEAARRQTPVISKSQAPFINHIYVKDLAKILLQLGHYLSFSGILNIADGKPMAMGQMQQLLAELLSIPKAPELDFTEIWQQASMMKKEFMSQNKRLSIHQLQQVLRNSKLQLTTMEVALKELVANF